MEASNETTPCSCGPILKNFMIQHGKDQMELKTLLRTMMKKIEQLESKPKALKSMGYQYLNTPTIRKPATPGVRPQIN